MSVMFRSLRIRNYRVWAGGALVSNIGSWMQRAVQDWLVLTELTDHSATAVGFTTGLQFGPQLLLMGVTGTTADRFDRRQLLLITNTAMGLIALLLGLLAVSGRIELWHVYVLAGLLGCVSAFDGPARQTFAAELVGEADLSNAIALNSSSFNIARLIGPATAGALISFVGSGWMFLINAATFVPMLIALVMLRAADMYGRRAREQHARIADGIRYFFRRRDLTTALVMLSVITAFGINSPIYIATMVTQTFHAGVDSFGFLTSCLATGSLIGALLNARRGDPDLGVLMKGAAAYGICLLIAGLAPNLAFFAVSLVGVGMATQTLTSNTNSYVQITTDPAMRGRVIAILFAIAMGCVPPGALLVGMVADQWGARWAVAMASTTGFMAALICFYRHRK